MINYGGHDLSQYGLAVERYPSRSFPTRKQRIYSIAGRNGDLIVDEGAFENIVQEYEVFVKKTAARNMQENLRVLAFILIGTVIDGGYTLLVDSYDPDVYRLARVIGGEEFLNSLNKFGRATLRFDCKPQRFPKIDEVYTGSPTATINYATRQFFYPARPILTLSNVAANTSLTITDSNGLSIVIPTRGASIATVLIDWENQTVINPYNNSIPSGTSVSGKWDEIGNSGWVKIELDSGTAPTYSLKTRRFYL